MEEFDRVGWAGVKENFKQNYGEYPTVLSLLFIIGLGETPSQPAYTKEQKQDVIHVGLCKILEQVGVYRFSHLDDEQWPHYQLNDNAKEINIEKQENYIKQLIIQYFKDE